MKKVAALLFLAILIFISNGYCQSIASGGLSAQASPSSDYNYTGFSKAQVEITPELESLTSPEFKSHPEYGVLPFNAPCKDCFELLQKRDETHRYFVKEGSKGKEFYA